MAKKKPVKKKKLSNLDVNNPHAKTMFNPTGDPEMALKQANEKIALLDGEILRLGERIAVALYGLERAELRTIEAKARVTVLETAIRYARGCNRNDHELRDRLLREGLYPSVEGKAG